MANNLKGVSGIKGLLLLHGEKIAIVLLGAAALWLIYKASTLPSLEAQYQADKLQDSIRQTNAAVTDATWPEKGSEQEKDVRAFEPIARGANPIVPHDPYNTTVLLDTPVIPPTIRRTDPLLLNAQDVYAHGGSGPLAFVDEEIRKAQALRLAAEAEELARKEAERAEKEAKAAEDGRNRGPEAMPDAGMIDPEHPQRRMVQGAVASTGVPVQGGERIERAYWAIVVAKVPIKEQLKLFQDAFSDAKLGFDPGRDFPQYMGFQVQRQEVTKGATDKWEPVPLYDGQKKSIESNKPINRTTVAEDSVRRLFEAIGLNWAGQVPDVLAEQYKHPFLTLPLPPLVGRAWGPEATHPDIPLLADTPVVPLETAAIAPEQKPAEGTTDEDSAFGSPGIAQGVPGQQGFGFTSPRGPMMGPEGMAGPGMRMPMRSMIGEGPMRGGPEGAVSYGGASMMGASGQMTTLPPGVEHLLLRFIDYTVEPGKKYKYRVRLVLRDPNYMLPESVLAVEVADRQRKEWQEDKARLKEKATRRTYRWVDSWSEPSRTVGIPLGGYVRIASAKLPPPEKINDEPTLTTYVESFDLDEQGNAIQAAKEKVFRRGYVANSIEKTRYLGPDGTWTDEMDGFRFVTGITLLDIEGGEKISRDATAPVRAMMMGPSGELYLRNELDDKTAVEYDKMLFTDDKRRQDPNQPFGPEGGFGGPGGPGRARGGRQ
jgi:hypothetical protein